VKKIVFIVTTLNAGGINNFLLNLLDNIKDSKPHITFLYTLGRGDAADKFAVLGVDIQPCLRHGNKNYKASYKASKLLRTLTMFVYPFSLFFKLKKIKPDVVYSHDHWGQAISAAFVCRLLNIKFIMQVHSNGSKPLNNKTYLGVLKLLYKKDDVVLFGSNSLKENYALLAKAMKANVEVIYYFINDLGKRNEPINKEIRIKLGIRNDETVIGYIGRLIDMKHVETLIQAFSELDASKYRLLIIGGGEKKEELEKFASKINNSNRIQFIGKVTNPDYWLNVFDLNVLPSAYEGQPIAVIECMSKGVINICSNVTGTREIIVDNENGLLFEFKNVKELREKIEFATVHTEVKEKIQENAYRFYNQNFSPEVLTVRFKALLNL